MVMTTNGNYYKTQSMEVVVVPLYTSLPHKSCSPTNDPVWSCINV